MQLEHNARGGSLSLPCMAARHESDQEDLNYSALPLSVSHTLTFLQHKKFKSSLHANSAISAPSYQSDIVG